jgi:Tol biopolymer transport system component/outer membrane lipoprotein-sorting protein
LLGGAEPEIWDFRAGAAEKVGGRDANVVHFKMPSGMRDKDAAFTVWIDAKTLLPLKRVIVLDPTSKATITETYKEFTLDPEIDAGAFELTFPVSDAEKLFRALKEKLKTAKAVQAAFDIEIKANGKGAKGKGTLLFTNENKVRFKMTFDEMGKKATTEAISDGKRMKYAKSPEVLAKAETDPTPPLLHSLIGAMVSGPGLWLTHEGEHLNAAAAGSFKAAVEGMRLVSFEAGVPQKFGGRDAKMITYMIAGLPGTADYHVTLWIDARTLLPFKRVIVPVGWESVRITETCEFTLNPKIDAKAFELPKGAIIKPAPADGNRPARAQEGKADILLITSLHGHDGSHSGPLFGSRIFRVNADGSGRTPLTSWKTGTFAADPALSPDGRQIAFVASTEAGTKAPLGLYVMKADGSQRKLLAEKLEGIILAPAWSPDGKRIAFCTAVYNFKGRSGKPRLYFVDADGKNLKRLENANGLMPAWSPDGKRLLFTREEKDTTSLCVVDVDGTNVRRLVGDGALMGAWSPDGKSLAYVVVDLGTWSDVRPEECGLFVARADGSERKRLAGGPEEIIFGIKWSADGKRLFFTRRGRGKTVEGGDKKPARIAPPPSAIYVIDIDGRNLRRVTAAKGPEYLGGNFLFGALLFYP